MKKTLWLCLFISLLSVFLAGCTTTPGGVCGSTTPITAQDNYVVVQKDVEGNSWCITLLCFDLWYCSPQQALQNAKTANNCDALVNVQLNTTTSFFVYKSYHVSGDAVKIIKK